MCKYKVEDWVGATELIIKLKPFDYECTFSRGKTGPRPLPGGVHVKIPRGGGTLNVEVIGMLVGNFFGKP